MTSPNEREPIPIDAIDADWIRRGAGDTVELRTWRGVVGEVRLRGGRVVGSNALALRVLREVIVVEPDTLAVLIPDDGERYLAALPSNLAGSYFRAVRR